MLYYSGALGNTVFFVCSSWFLVDSNRVNKKKMLYMALDVWVISVIIFIATYSLGIDKMDPWVMFVQLFPNIFANNWYITCYLIFYSIHPVLNGIINNLNQRTMLRCTLVLSILYICFNFISTFFFPSPIQNFILKKSYLQPQEIRKQYQPIIANKSYEEKYLIYF